MSKKYPTYAIELYQGNTESIPIAFYSKSGDTKTPIMLDNSADIAFIIRDAVSMDALLVMSKSANEIEVGTLNQDGDTFIADTTNQGDNYAIRLTFPSSLTEELAMPKMVYELMLVRAEDDRELLLHGTIYAQNGATGYVRT